jgi:hypothetical protein
MVPTKTPQVHESEKLGNVCDPFITNALIPRKCIKRMKDFRRLYVHIPPGLKVSSQQGCRMVYFQTKNSNLDKFWRELQRKTSIYALFVYLFYDHLVYFIDVGYIFGYLVYISRFGMLYHE